MTKFLVLYRSSVPAVHQTASATPEQMQGMDRWKAWMERAQPAIVDVGTPLGFGIEIVGRSVGESSSRIAGYCILQAESQSVLINLLLNHPHHLASSASIELLEMLPMPGM